MKVGFFTMPLHPPGSVHSETLDSDLEQLVLLDKLGFEEAWIGEHFTAEWENIPSPDLLIAQASAITKKIKFGTGVTCMPNHNPFTIAHRIAQLDQMLKGRFIWGVGSGGFPGDLAAFGFETKGSENRQMSFESVDLVLKLWTDPTPGRYKSKWWDFSITDVDDEIGMRVHMVPYQKPHPPIGVAGVSAKSETLVMAGEKGWLPMSINFVPSRVLKTHWDSVKKRCSDNA
ncbi:MAG: LLM class flavin-dependent oxidoreductase [Dehalococcoidia bacterium]|jgi:alkanesulfonate monooxygenase SsuD/methylene tetrahydromethanopterin reductase-like flavin-dependent oxidoreductase (luciferase family)|nr:LLM class flavin-dependent oxidoreductase [Dehalococcoidia bacterium]MDP7613007.1 LLM class flavin-dependent oxidoreductase [Dehalococcoidia bacterium]